MRFIIGAAILGILLGFLVTSLWGGGGEEYIDPEIAELQQMIQEEELFYDQSPQQEQIKGDRVPVAPAEDPSEWTVEAKLAIASIASSFILGALGIVFRSNRIKRDIKAKGPLKKVRWY